MNSARNHHPLTPYAFLAPASAVLAVFVLGAALQVLWFSFTSFSAFTPAEFVGINNYRELLTKDLFLICLLNSAAYLFVTPVIVVLSLLAAIAVDARLRALPGLRLLLFLPVVTPAVVGALAWRLVFDENNGLLNDALSLIGIQPVRWLSERPWTLISAMLVTAWKGFGFYMMVFLAGLLTVPRDLREAAAIDGATRPQVFWTVTLPALKPSLVLVVVVSSISALKVFDEVFVTIAGAPITHQTAVPLIYQLAFERGQFGLASAAGVLLFLVILAFSIVNMRLSAGRKA